MIRKRKADNATKIFYNLEQLKKLCAEWQTRLKLQDWTIDVKLVRYYEDIEGLAGQIEWWEHTREAVIRLLDPHDIPEPPRHGTASTDLETVLVHELLHLHFACCTNAKAHPPDSPSRIMIEQSINAITMGLINLKRESNN